MVWIAFGWIFSILLVYNMGFQRGRDLQWKVDMLLGHPEDRKAEEGING